ncbi:acetyl/propionyl/methylcrotonyl-CoA carboxylase subunit alpha [Myceligenerans xiligouense]|uniref:biotin carboxylase n=1 Tax=Myceligenerans xiligouense TaxID=253184 RepID=A0A3N4YS88_9MICO|nr:biotin carboxylase N-terminal domain-containing protein [Myceligenerans xiligouense]RPF21420.1 acetyl-CoA/propionyl-CoA carboxylase biotin carboxyl carrier protein [Myceligenerans xiligouense]
MTSQNTAGPDLPSDVRSDVPSHAARLGAGSSGDRPFRTVLVANRGEIAVRVIRTLRRLGIRSVAVHSDADAGAPHTRLADTAVRIGPAPATSSYLDIDAVIGAARTAGADAIHPGYGFLSENPAFARACAAAGITLVGPPPEAMEAMADKISARDLVAARGVPVLPGTTGATGGAGAPGSAASDADLLAAAGDVGFPLIVKPAAGGGGKGMQVVEDAAALPAALVSARRVAAAAFGDDSLLLERYVPDPRHIEVQVLADTHGTVIHLGERECSLQRRHQKVIEEAPSALLAGLPDDVARAIRARMGEAACEVARACGYVGAGTVEMLVPGLPTGHRADAPCDPAAPDPAAPDPAALDFWFLEMNTRLQVEHPVTEAVTGLDLVELQLRVAAGEKLPLAQDDVEPHGHAVEARVYAEAPARGFLPDTGTVLAHAQPAGPGVRVDSGIATGSVIGGDYDPMLAKVIAHGTDRAQALDRLDRALAGSVVLGVETNTGWLRELLAHPDVRAGRIDTGLIERAGDPAEPEPDDADLTAAARALALHHPEKPAYPRVRRFAVARATGQTWPAVAGAHQAPRLDETVPPPGPWTLDGFRPGAPPEPVRYEIAGRLVTTDGPIADGQESPGAPAPASPRGAAHRAAASSAEPASATSRETPPTTAVVQESGRGVRTVWLHRAGRTLALAAPTRAQAAAARRAARAAAAQDGEAAGPDVRAAMPGTVAWVAEDGDVGAGDTLVVVEAMKMEHPLDAPHDGTATVRVAVGDQVRRDQVVATVTAGPAGAGEPSPADDERPAAPGAAG